MRRDYSRKHLLLSVSMLLLVFLCHANVKEQRKRVAMRMIGDQVLLHLGDSTSRVLGIEKENKKYKIPFETEFGFNPDSLINIIHGVIIETGIAVKYFVEVEECTSKKIIYNYEKGILDSGDFVPCRMRPQPKGCYTFYITLLDSNVPFVVFPTTTNSSPPLIKEASTNGNNYSYYFVFLLLLPIGFVIYFLKQKRQSKINPDLITIGEYQFDKKGMKLFFNTKSTELSSKETDLLFLLYSNENETLEREHILNVIWGDEGDYIGRTLDVFISKLRKKLEQDSNLKIVNIRGVGYRFVVNGK